MTHRKFAADQLFTGYRMLGDGAILVTDEAGVVIDIIHASEAGEGIERYNGILSPGFINCHCHLELSHMKGMISPNAGMIDFLLTVMNDRSTNEEYILNAIEQAESYMIQKGIVAVGDICNTGHSIPLKKQKNLYYHNFIEATGFIEETAESRFREVYDLFLNFIINLDHDEAGSTISIVPHAPYSVSDKLFQFINGYRKGNLLSMHNQESLAETQFFTSGKGDFLNLYESLGIELKEFNPGKGSSLTRTLEKVSPDHSLILVHNVHTTKEDLEWIGAAEGLPELFWCLCPNANLYINGSLPDVSLFQEFNCNIVIGTDSLASNTQLNVLEEIKTLQKNFPSLTTEDLLKWSTVHGADALRIKKKYGSFEIGKTPGIVNIEGGSDGLLAGTVARKVL